MTAPGGMGLPATVNQFHQFEPRMGSEYVMAAFSTPGTARSRSTASAKNACFRGSGQAGPASENMTVCRLCGSKPGSTRDSRSIVWTISPDPESSTVATATSPISRLRRSSECCRVEPRPDRNTVCMAAGARRPQCGQHAEQERTGTTEERRAGQHDDVQADLVEAWCIRGRDADETGEDRGAGKCTEHATGPNQQRVFDEQLTDQAPPAAADRRADAELVRARRAPVQQQAGQVDAGDEQQQRDGAGEHSQRWRHVPDHAVGERDDVDAAAPLLVSGCSSASAAAMFCISARAEVTSTPGLSRPTA